MRRVLGVSVIALVVMVMGAATASASVGIAGGDGVSIQQNGGEGGALVLRGDLGCGIPVPGGGVSGGFHLVVTPSGNASLVCHGEIPEGPPETVTLETPCFLGPGGFGEGRAVITPSGQVHLVCKATSG